MKVQNISKYRTITVKGVKMGPKEIKDIPGLDSVEVMSTNLRTKLIIVGEVFKKATPKTVKKISKPKEEVEPREEPTGPWTSTGTGLYKEVFASSSDSGYGGVMTSSDTRGSPIGSKNKKEKSEKE